MSHPKTCAKRDRGWTYEIKRSDGTVERGELTVPDSDAPFNDDGYWKAVLLEPDGRLHCVRVMGVTADLVEAPPKFFIWWHDAAMNCNDVPGFICVMGHGLGGGQGVGIRSTP